MGNQPSIQANATASATAIGTGSAAAVPQPQVFVTGLRPEFKRFTNESLKYADRIQARFERNFSRVHTGWQIDQVLYQIMFDDSEEGGATNSTTGAGTGTGITDSKSSGGLSSSAAGITMIDTTTGLATNTGGIELSPKSSQPLPEPDELFPLWDTDQNGLTDVLEILGALILLSHSNFDAKLSAVFELFDFDGNDSWNSDEMTIAVKSCVMGLCKVTGLVGTGSSTGGDGQAASTHGPSAIELDKIATEAFHSADILKDGKITRHELLQWCVCTPKVLASLLRFGTTDRDAVWAKYADVQARAIATRKIQVLYKSTKQSEYRYTALPSRWLTYR